MSKCLTVSHELSYSEETATRIEGGAPEREAGPAKVIEDERRG
jgi:hypothetical protein